MPKVNKFRSVFYKFNNSRETNEIYDIDFSQSDEENQSLTYNNNSFAEINLNETINEKPAKRATTAQRRAKRFNPLRCVDGSRDSSRRSAVGSQKSDANNDYRKSLRNEEENIAGLEKFCELFGTQEPKIDWDSSNELIENVEKEKLAEAAYSIDNSEDTTGPQSQAKTECSQSNVFKGKNLLKRCRKGGYLQLLKVMLDKTKTNQKFLKYDQKFGTRDYKTLKVLEIKHSFGVAIATCSSSEREQKYDIILDRELGHRAKIGDQLEAFYEENCETYQNDNSRLPIVLQPRQVLLQSWKKNNQNGINLI